MVVVEADRTAGTRTAFGAAFGAAFEERRSWLAYELVEVAWVELAQLFL